MKIMAVVDRALQDEAFALQLRDQALEASRAGVKSSAWETFAANFAESPDELMRLKGALAAGGGKGITTATSFTTTTTTSTAACTTTTTTLTTTTTTEI